MKHFYKTLLLLALGWTAQSAHSSEFSKKVHSALEQISKKQIPVSELKSCGPLCISFLEKNSGWQFVIQIDSSLSKPELVLDFDSKTLSLPSMEDISSPNRNLFQKFLTGHIWHPYLNRQELKPSQQTALKAFERTLKNDSKSFLHSAPTGMGKTRVLATALLHQIQNSAKKIFIVTAHQIQLVHQLFSAIELEKQRQGLTQVKVVNWNQSQKTSWKHLAVNINQSVTNSEILILVITSQSLKSKIENFQTQDTRIYTTLVQNLGGVYIDEAHHLGAEKTHKTIIENLMKDSGAFLYGTTATPDHYEMDLRNLFQTHHWSYLNTETNLLEEHSLENILQQLQIGINQGEITFFDDTYVIGENSFQTALEEANGTNQNLFITEQETPYRELNPAVYERLAEILFPIFEDNLKGFIVTAGIREAERVSEFFNKKFQNIKFESYHSNQPLDERKQVLKRSYESKEPHYIVAVRALDEGVDLPHLSAYIDLNSEISLKQRVHRIGRVLRLAEGKMQSDVLFLINYRNQEMLENTLLLLETMEKVSFRGEIKRKKRQYGLNLGFQKPESLSREDLVLLRAELKKSVKKFWSMQDNGPYLSMKEWFEAVENYNKKLREEGRPIINSENIGERYKEIPGSPKYPNRYYNNLNGEGAFAQAGGWARVTRINKKNKENQIEINGELRHLTMEEWFEAVESYNKKLQKEGRPIINSENIGERYKEIPGSPKYPNSYYNRLNGEKAFTQAGGWARVTRTNKKNKENQIEINGELRHLTMEEWFEAVESYNKKLREEGQPIINSRNIGERYTEIPGSSFNPRDYYDNRHKRGAFTQAGGWARVTGVIFRVSNLTVINGELRFLTLKEWFEAMKNYNKKLQEKGQPIINSRNIGERYTEIPGSPYDPREYYDNLHGRGSFTQAGGWVKVQHSCSLSFKTSKTSAK